jgi:lysozyme
MKISQTGIDLIKRFEGLRLNAYRDAVGVWTIGYGHTATAKPGQRISAERAEELLRRDLETFERGVERRLKVEVNQAQFDAMVSLAFNVGLGAFGKSTLLRLVNRGAYSAAADQFGRWVYAGGRKLRGLVRRRQAERELFVSRPETARYAAMSLAGGSSLDKAMAAFRVFRRGMAVADPAVWKNRQVAINAVFAAVSALAILAAKLGWLPTEIQTETIQQFSEGVALAVLAILNVLATWATSEKVGVGDGVLPRPDDVDELLDDPESVPTTPERTVGQGGGDRSSAEQARDTWLGD